MDFQTPVHIPASDFQIGYTTPSLLMGSCFTEEIGQRMQVRKLPVWINPTGILFNPASIAITLDRFAEHKAFEEDELLCDHARWVSLGHHSRFSGNSRNDLETLLQKAAENGHHALTQADTLIFTWGTAWIYESTVTGQVVANCHRLPAAAFHRRRLSVEEIVTQWSQLIERHLFNKRVILTISPIRHLKDGLIENQLSKATLTVAAHLLCERFPHVHYFPAYEILNDELRDYRFYNRDMIHPSAVAADFIWERFVAWGISQEAAARFPALERLHRAVEHRTLDPDSTTYDQFRSKTLETITALEKSYPDLNFDPERRHFSSATTPCSPSELSPTYEPII